MKAFMGNVRLYSKIIMPRKALGFVLFFFSYQPIFYTDIAIRHDLMQKLVGRHLETDGSSPLLYCHDNMAPIYM